MRTLHAGRTAGLLGVLILPLLAGLDAPSGRATDSSAVLVSDPAPRPSSEAPRSTESGSQAAPVRKAQSPLLGQQAGSGGAREPRPAFPAGSAHAGLKPACGSALLTELTKPAYLLVRLLGTPTNHRAPPA